MTTRVRRVRVVAAAAMALATGLALLSGCSGTARPAYGQTTVASDPTPRPTVAPITLPAKDPYVHLANELHQRGVQIWFETDLVARWLQGTAAFDTAVARVGALARLPGVAGIKIADELGYNDGLDTPERTSLFLADAAQALHAIAPSTKLLVDAIVPELGCLPWKGSAEEQCASSARSDHPAATEEAMTSYLHSGNIDVLDLSTGLLDPSQYQSWGTDLHQAQADIWAHVAGSDWPKLTRLQSRKALAEPGGYSGSDTQASDDVGTYVDVPVAAGAAAVDIWTWRQTYDGQVVSLLGDGLADNPLWTDLRSEHARGVHLITHMTPSNMPTQEPAFGRECDKAAEVFSAIFVAAGTG